MTTTGTTSFSPEFTEIAEEAFERAGRELRSGYDLRTARRSMNLLTIEWSNRGVNMWTMEQGTINLTQGLSTYALPTDTIDLMDHVIRTGANTQSTQQDLTISRISVDTYASIPAKLNQARPIQIWVQRLSGEVSPLNITLTASINSLVTTIPVSSVADLPSAGFVKINSEIIYYGYLNVTTNALEGCFRGQANTTAASHSITPTPPLIYNPNLPAATLWPTPDGSQPYQLVYWRLRRMKDAGSGVQTPDINFRFLPCLMAGLAYYIANKIPEGQERIDRLKLDYEEQFALAAGEDREKATARFVPRIIRIY
jgi:hypothetical protein